MVWCNGYYCEPGYSCAASPMKCCPNNLPVPCPDKCCPAGMHCDAACGGCVEDEHQCCPDGVTKCLIGKICWTNGAETKCLDSADQDCGDYACDVNYVCAATSGGCCPAASPQGCGNTCCLAYETCYDVEHGGVCVNEQIGEKYCGNGGLICAPDLVCMKYANKCMPSTATECHQSLAPGTKSETGYYCPQGTSCDEKQNKKYCIPTYYESNNCYVDLDEWKVNYCPQGYNCTVSCCLCKVVGAPFPAKCCPEAEGGGCKNCEEKNKVDYLQQAVFSPTVL